MFDKNDTLKVKGIGIICLLFHHLFLSERRILSNDIELTVCSVQQLQSMAVGARICVWIFAFLSAYGLTCQYIKQKDKNVSAFVGKRWLSLMQSFWFIYPVVFVLSFVFFQNPWEFYGKNILHIILDFMGIADFWGTPMLSSVWWYMCFAQVVILIFPILYIMCDVLGTLSLPVVFILLQYMGEGIHSSYGGYYTNYLFAVVLAILCAQKDFFSKVSGKSDRLVFRVLEGCVLISATLLFIYLRVIYVNNDNWKITTVYYSIAVLLICVFVNKYLKGRFFSKFLILLGAHSGNIFMIHSFIYIYYPDFVYASHNVIISVITLLLISLICSWLIEWLKKICKYNIAFDRLGTIFYTK